MKMNKTEERIAELKSEMGIRLFKAALAELPQNPTRAREMVKATKGRKKTTIKAGAEMVLELAELIRSARREKRATRRACYARGRWGGRPLDGRSLDRARRSREAEIAYKLRCICGDTSGENVNKITFGDYVSCQARVDTSHGEQYSSSCKYRRLDSVLRATVQRGTWARLQRESIGRLDGMVTIAAEPLDTGDSSEIAWRAKWVRKGRGCSLVMEEGVILRKGREYTHGKTLASARSTLTRRANVAKWARREKEIVEKLRDGKVNGYAPITVTVADSIRCGNCKEGTENFIETHLDGRRTATVEELVELSRSQATGLQRMILGACFAAICRQKPAG